MDSVPFPGGFITHSLPLHPNQWTSRTIRLLNGASAFISPFPNATNIIYEQQCEQKWNLNVDQYSFKAYLARWLGQTSILVPRTAERIREVLKASSAAVCYMYRRW
jgi:mannan endo-1,6-alpha-mannosidase